MSHPIQYHVPVFQALAQDPRVDLTVYFCWDFGVREQRDPEFGTVFKWDIPMLEGYRHVFLRNWSLHPGPTFLGGVNPVILGELWRGRYDAILVHGYQMLTHWLAFLGARLSGTPVLLRGISHVLDERPGSVRAMKRLLLPPLFKLATRVLTIGKHNCDYYRAYGVPERKFVHTPHVVSNDFFASHCARLRPKRSAIRTAFGIVDDAPVILFPGKLRADKDPLLLLDVYQRVRRRQRCHLLYVGEGPLRGEIEARIERDAVPDVVLTGFLNQTEMPKAYLAADLVVLPSRATETWGLVVNEGMNFGLPMIVSDRVGCGTDLVRTGENGFIFDTPAALETALEDLVSDPALRETYGRRSLELIANWGIPESLEGIVEAVRQVAKPE